MTLSFEKTIKRSIRPIRFYFLWGILILIAGCNSDSEFVAEPIITRGWTNYRTGEFKFAIRDFESVLAEEISHDDQIKATYGLATTWALRRPNEDPVKAAQLYKRILKLNPKHELAPWSLLGLARLKHMVSADKTFDPNQVCKAYQDVIDRYPNTLAAEEAFTFQQTIQISSFDPQTVAQTIDTLDRFIQTHPKSPFVSFAYTLQKHGYMTLNQPEKVLQAAIRAYETQIIDPDVPFIDNSAIYWEIAAIAEFEVGDFTTARAYYNKLLKEYPIDFRCFPAKQALKRMDELEARFRLELSKENS